MDQINHILIDRHFVGVNKPNRIGVSRDASGDVSLLETVREWNASRQAEGKKGYCSPVHFLDRPVSGAMVFALSSKGASRLSKSFRDRKIQKNYLALVHGVVPKQETTLSHWLRKDSETNTVYVCKENDENGKFCQLRYQVVANDGEFSLLRIQLMTGRSHQIRVQLSTIGYPIVGDGKYGSTQKHSGKIALHCSNLAFAHPTTREMVNLSAPTPDWWANVSDNLFEQSRAFSR